MRQALLTLTALALLVGCAAPKQDRDVAKATENLQTATVDLTKAKAANARAKIQIETGRGAAAELKLTATAQQLPYIQRLETALAQVSAENAEITLNLESMEHRVVEAQKHVVNNGATIADLRGKNARYQKLKLWIMLFSGAAAAYVAFKLVPPLGPVRYYAMIGAAGQAALLVYLFL